MASTTAGRPSLRVDDWVETRDFVWGSFDLACSRFSGRAAPPHSVSNGRFLLPYEAVRRSADPDRTLLGFLQSTYEAAAINGAWDREALEDDPGRWRDEQLRRAR